MSTQQEIIDRLTHMLEDQEQLIIDHEELLEERHSTLLAEALDIITELQLEIIRLKNGGEE